MNKNKKITNHQLRKIVQEKFGLFLDFDGTLSAIVNNPDQASLYGNNSDLLKELSEYFPIVILSGRSVESLLDRIKIPTLQYVGNHGMEILKDNKTILPENARAYLTNIENALTTLEKQITDPKVYLENKKITISVHYRNVAEPSKTRDRLAPLVEKIAKENELAVFEGRMIFELRPPIQINKGTIFREMVKNQGLQSAMMIGDDITDTHAFIQARNLQSSNECNSFSLAVVEKETAQEVIDLADFTLSGVTGANQFLSSLLIVARESST